MVHGRGELDQGPVSASSVVMFIGDVVTARAHLRQLFLTDSLEYAISFEKHTSCIAWALSDG